MRPSARVLVALLLIAAPSAAQQPSQPPPPPQPSAATPSQPVSEPDLAKVPLSLDRIRQGVEREDSKLRIDFLGDGTPLFRVAVRQKPLTLEEYWKFGPDTAVSRDVRPSYASTWHHEFLSMTTPKQQIAASPFGIFGNPVHPVGPPVLAIRNAIARAWRSYQEDQIRKQIDEELKALEAQRDEPSSDPPPKDPPPKDPPF